MKDYPYVPGWRLNKENNKPAIKHSVLMLTTHGVAEGEWDGNEWVQYRWSCKVKDSDVLYWIHLEDLTQLEKEGDSLQQEQPECGCSEKPNDLLSEPSLPSNLDEAAKKVEDYYDVGEEHGYLCCHRGDIKDAFKAGAEWMAGQGVTKEAVIGMATEEISINVSKQTLDDLDPCPGDKVVVQIRKK